MGRWPITGLTAPSSAGWTMGRTISTWVDNGPVAHYRVDRTVGTWVDNGPGCYCRGRRYTAEYMGPAESAEAVMNVTTVVPFSGVGFVADVRGPARAVPNDTLYAFCNTLGTIHCSSTTCSPSHLQNFPKICLDRYTASPAIIGGPRIRYPSCELTQTW